MFGFRNWRRRRVLARAQVDERAWAKACARVPLLAGFDADELRRLRDLVVLFLHEKSIEATDSVELNDVARLVIALQACIPILNLGLDYYDGWHSVIVYPNQFRPRHEVVGDDEVVHVDDDWKLGESWDRGPVILSWEDVQAAGQIDGFNLVIHEFAHKLDMLDGAANGAPPMHDDMNIRQWAAAFTPAYADFCGKVDAGVETAIDPYAAESPEEFFAVLSEAFFEIPEVVRAEYPAVYEQLRQFYRQDPDARRAPVKIPQH